MKSLITLSPEESKRLIAKAIVQLPQVKTAKEKGIIGIARCTSGAYVVEELIDRKLANKNGYCSGFFVAQGSCAVQTQDQEKLLVLSRGKEQWLTSEEGNISKFIGNMNCHDIIIKSGNILDCNGEAGTLVASPSGGEIGSYLPHILAIGIQLIVPMTINKTVSDSLHTIVSSMGITKIEPSRCHGMPCGVIPLPGQIITEIHAIHLLTKANALPVAVNGIGSGAGSVMLLIDGPRKYVDRAWEIIEKIKGEPPMADPLSPCDHCYLLKHPSQGVRCSTRKGRTLDTGK